MTHLPEVLIRTIGNFIGWLNEDGFVTTVKAYDEVKISVIGSRDSVTHTNSSVEIETHIHCKKYQFLIAMLLASQSISTLIWGILTRSKKMLYWGGNGILIMVLGKYVPGAPSAHRAVGEIITEGVKPAFSVLCLIELASAVMGIIRSNITCFIKPLAGPIIFVLCQCLFFEQKLKRKCHIAQIAK